MNKKEKAKKTADRKWLESLKKNLATLDKIQRLKKLIEK